MTTKDFRNLVITETKKILINEDISGELEQSNRSQGNHLQGNDEIGEFNIVVHPIEGNVIEDIVKKVSIPHLLQKVKNGEIQIENIHSICKKDNSATTKGKKLLKEFNSSLQSGRKAQLEQMQTKRKGYQLHLDGYKLSSKNRELDEAKNMQLKKLEELISRFDNQIAELQKKINENKKPINESLSKKEQLRELFGFGSSAETKGMSPEEKKDYESCKSIAKDLFRHGGKGKRIGMYINHDKKWLQHFEPYFPKMNGNTVAQLLDEAPQLVGHFLDAIKYKKLLSSDKLAELARVHPELDKIFDKYGFDYYRFNKKEGIDELFGFGKKKDQETIAREKHEDEMKYFAKVMCKGNRGKEIGEHLVTNIDDIKYFAPYIQKMSSEDIKDILMECPKVIMFFDNVLDKIGSYYAYFLVQKHPELAKVFDKAGLSYGKVNK